MKKKFLVTLAFAGLLSLVACGYNDGTNSANRYNRYNRGLDNITYNRDNNATSNRGYFNNNTANRDYNNNITNRRNDYNNNNANNRSYDYSDSMANNRGYDYNDNITSNRGNSNSIADNRSNNDNIANRGNDNIARNRNNNNSIADNRGNNYNDSTRDNLNNRTDQHYDFVTRLGFKNVVNPNGHTYQERYRLNKANAANNDIFHGWRHSWVDPDKYVDKDIDVYRYTGDFNGESRTIHIMSYNGEVLGGYHYGSGETVEDARIINYNGYSSRISNDFRGTWDGLFDT